MSMFNNSKRAALVTLLAGAFASSLMTMPVDARGGGARAGGGGARSGVSSMGGARSAPTSINRAGGGNRAYNTGGTNRVNNGNVGSGGNRINTGNVNVGNNVNIDVDNGWNGHGYHPIATGVAVGVAVGVTANVIGYRAYALPASGCSPYYYSSYSYYHCGSVWYQPQYQGTTVTYVVVNAPN